jgi:hypothetical protein
MKKTPIDARICESLQTPCNDRMERGGDRTSLNGESPFYSARMAQSLAGFVLTSPISMVFTDYCDRFVGSCDALRDGKIF